MFYSLCLAVQFPSAFRNNTHADSCDSDHSYVLDDMNDIAYFLHAKRHHKTTPAFGLRSQGALAQNGTEMSLILYRGLVALICNNSHNLVYHIAVLKLFLVMKIRPYNIRVIHVCLL